MAVGECRWGEEVNEPSENEEGDWSGQVGPFGLKAGLRDDIGYPGELADVTTPEGQSP